MKKVITSFGIGSHSPLLSLSVKTLYAYSYSHNYDLFIPSVSFFKEETKILPPSWWKLDIIEHLLNSYDQVLWMDADVLICRFDIDISTEMNEDSVFGLVVHETPDGSVPNCGVWFLNKSFLDLIPKIRSHNNFRRSEHWWEQASLIHLMGADPDSTPVVLPSHYDFKWTQFNYVWNPHINDHRKIPDDTKFFHATSYNDRYAVMKNVLNQINI